MAIEANTPNDWGMRGATNTTLPQFQGVPRQLVVNIDDGYRPVIMDGTTLGGKFKCTSLDELNSGLATKLGKTDKAESAKIADSAVNATKALQDYTGNNIVETYATKTEVTQGLAKIVLSVNDVTPDVFGNVSVDVGVKTIEGRTPDDNGNIRIPFRNVGEEWHSFTGKIPAGGVPYCGQEVTRATYADLWAYAQNMGLVKTEEEWQALATSRNGNVPFYSSGDGSTTFRMPKVVGYIKGAASLDEAGAYTAEGLPNITGELGAIENSGVYAAGAFYAGAPSNRVGSGDSDSDNKTMYFDASRSSSIYGNSSHVTPETSVVMFGVYAFGAVINAGELDATTLATGLARVESNLEVKVDKTTPHVIETWHSGASWYRVWSDGFIEQGGDYTSSDNNKFTITLNRPMTTTNYHSTVTGGYNMASNYGFGYCYDKTTSGFKAVVIEPRGTWYVCGY